MSTAPMPAARFWALLEQAAKENDDPEAHLKALRHALSALSLDDVIAFEVAFRQYLNEAYTWDLWAAAHIVNGGCGDDGFEYFRRWLVAQGRDVYEAALNDPDSLAGLELQPGPEGVWEFEEFYDLTAEVYAEKGGTGDVIEHAQPEAAAPNWTPSGEPFEDGEAHLAQRLPRLWKRYGDAPLG